MSIAIEVTTLADLDEKAQRYGYAVTFKPLNDAGRKSQAPFHLWLISGEWRQRVLSASRLDRIEREFYARAGL